MNFKDRIRQRAVDLGGADIGIIWLPPNELPFEEFPSRAKRKLNREFPNTEDIRVLDVDEVESFFGMGGPRRSAIMIRQQFSTPPTKAQITETRVQIERFTEARLEPNFAILVFP